MTNKKNCSIPTIFVVLGATGDLMTKKIVPALFALHEKKELPQMFELVGVSRRDWTDEDFKSHVKTILGAKVPDAPQKSVNSFLALTTYRKITFENSDDYVALGDKLKKIDEKWGVCTNKLFYLSVPPQFYDEIFENLHKSHLTDPCSPEEGWTRIIVEKPFGSDEKSAKALDAHLSNLFKEIQIYRIDHYLAKETFQNIMAFRFANNLFENQWGNELIEKIYIRELENVGVEDRGAFYESVGALRDVGQNHLLQMLALTTMDAPRSLTADAMRANRAAILETLLPMTAQEIKKQTFRAQYEGYRKIKGVAPDSSVETYFHIRTELSHPRWQGVPIIMEAGKRLAKSSEDENTEIEVVLKHPEPCLCGMIRAAEKPAGGHFKNQIIFRQDPRESITIHFWSKKPGLEMSVEERTFEFELRHSERKTQYTEEYEKLLLDCIAGDQTLFVASPEIAAMWRFVDPIERGWAKDLVPLRRYAPDSPAITAEAAALMTLRESSAADDSRKVIRAIGVVGLGKMGMGLARQLHEKGWRVVTYNRNLEKVAEIEKEGVEGARSIDELVNRLRIKDQGSRIKSPVIIWLMVTAGKPVDEFLFGKKKGPSTRDELSRTNRKKDGLADSLRAGDIVIDGGNSFFEDTVRRSKILARKGIRFLDAGVSGGPAGARNGACVMVGGDIATFRMLEQLFADMSVSGGYAHLGPAGSGHFVKMVHNGIEYGMMQSIAEGFALMKKSPFKLDLEKIAKLYNNGSVIESRLVGWLGTGFKKFGTELKDVSGSVAYTGEGEWTIKTGKKWKMKLPAIEDAFKFRVRSKKSPSYMGKILSTLRNQFGGHSTSGK